MKKLLSLLLFTFAFGQAYAQPKFVPKFIRRMLFEKDSSKRSSYFLLPVLSSAPETGIEAGGSVLYSFYTDTLHPGTRVSNIFSYATITTKGQERLSLSTTYWAPQNAWHYLAGLNFINFPSDFYGIGNNTLEANKDHIGEKRFRVNLEADKKLGNLYAGIVAGGFDYHFSNHTPGGIFDTDPRVEDRSGGTSLFIGPSLIFDTRNNNTYTTKGLIVTAYLNAMQGILANNSYQGGFFNIEYSQFFAFSRRVVLGVDIQDQNLIGRRSPFYLLPALGSDEMMRGYYNGRYRDRNLIAGQTELRLRISDRIGLAGFLGTGTVYNQSFSFNDLKPNYGGGVRYFFDVEKGLSMRMDYGFGEKRPGEKRQSGLYLALGESF